VSQQRLCYQQCSSLAPLSSLALRYLRTGYLWDNVRVIGGAYGGFCNFNPTTGLFSFLSYRDPNLAKTLDTYDGTAAYLQDLHLTAGEGVCVYCCATCDAIVLNCVMLKHQVLSQAVPLFRPLTAVTARDQ
jgi:Zn-dependent M16 (insulinase) family peptidase